MKIDTPFCFFFFVFLVLGSLSCLSALAQDGTRRSLKSSLGTFLTSIAWFLIEVFFFFFLGLEASSLALLKKWKMMIWLWVSEKIIKFHNLRHNYRWVLMKI